MSITINLGDYYDCTEMVFKDIVTDKQLKIPYNQRPWTWRDKELKKLWNSIVAGLGKYYVYDGVSDTYMIRTPPTGNPHFFGVFVFSDLNGHYLVVDGQQRITAMTIVVSCLRSRVCELCTDDIDMDIRGRALELRAKCTEWLKYGSGDFQPRLVTDSVLENVYQAFVAKPHTDKDRQKLVGGLASEDIEYAVHKRLIDAFRWFEARTSSIKRTSWSDKRFLTYLEAMFDVVSNIFVCLRVISKKESFSFEVFSCLNTTGLPLSEADKIKNELFVLTKSMYHKDLISTWDSMVNRVPDGNMEEFLRFRYLGRVGECKKKDLHEKYMENELKSVSNESLVSLVGEWNKDSDFLARAMLTKGQVSEGTLEALNELHRYLKITYARPFLISAFRVFQGNDLMLCSAVQMIVNFVFRTRTVGGVDVSQLEDWVGRVARGLTANTKAIELGNIFRKLHSDEEFKESFKYWTESRKKIQFYTLWKIEKQIAKGRGSGIEPYPSSPGQHVEHIMPQNLSKANGRQNEWSFARDSGGGANDKHSLYLNRLGNLTILESDINGGGGVSNYDFSVKSTGVYPGARNRKSYKDSNLSLVKKLVVDYKEWSFDQIDSRQGELAEAAVKTWPLRTMK